MFATPQQTAICEFNQILGRFLTFNLSLWSLRWLSVVTLGDRLRLTSETKCT